MIRVQLIADIQQARGDDDIEFIIMFIAYHWRPNRDIKPHIECRNSTKGVTKINECIVWPALLNYEKFNPELDCGGRIR